MSRIDMRLLAILGLLCVASVARAGGYYPGVPTLSQYGALRGYQVACSRGSTPALANGQAGAGANTASTYEREICPYGVNDIRLVYPGFYLDNSTNEVPYPNSIFVPTSITVTNTSASGYVVGDTVTMPNTGSNATATVMVVTAVSAGAPTQLNFVEPGFYDAPLAANTAASATSGSGTGTITYSFSYTGYAYAVRVSLIYPYIVTVSGTTLTGYTYGTNGVNGLGAQEYNILVPSGGYGVSDSIPVNQSGVVTIGLIQYAHGPRWVFNRSTQSSRGEASATANNITDRTQSGTLTASTAGMAIHPIMILGKIPNPGVATPSVLLFGDSIMQSFYSVNGMTTSNDTGDSNGNMGPGERAIGNTYAFANFASSGDRVSYWITNAFMRLNMLRQLAQQGVIFNVALTEWGVNDGTAGLSAATIEADYQIIWSFLQSIGIKNIVQSTITPHTTTSNNWATSGSANQTFTTGSTVINTVNSDLRSGTFKPTLPPNKFCVADIEAVATGGFGAGYWLGANDNGTVNATYDGVHEALLFIPNLTTAWATGSAPCVAVNF